MPAEQIGLREKKKKKTPPRTIYQELIGSAYKLLIYVTFFFFSLDSQTVDTVTLLGDKLVTPSAWYHHPAFFFNIGSHRLFVSRKSFHCVGCTSSHSTIYFQWSCVLCHLQQ